MKFKLKDGLLLGTATSATQIEGGDENNNWARFAKDGKIYDGTSPVRAADHYVRWRDDVDLMAEMGLKIYISILAPPISNIIPVWGRYEGIPASER